jgi:hypothetical protein
MKRRGSMGGSGRGDWVRSTKPYVTAAHLGGQCCTCGMPIAARTPALFIAWGVKLAHVECGWPK